MEKASLNSTVIKSEASFIPKQDESFNISEDDLNRDEENDDEMENISSNGDETSMHDIRVSTQKNST